MLGRRKFVGFVVRFPGYWPSRAAERVQEILLVLSQWKPFSGLKWWELLKLYAEGSTVEDGMCRVVDIIHVLMQLMMLLRRERVFCSWRMPVAFLL